MSEANAVKPEILNVETTSKMIDLKVGTIYNLVNQKKIPFIRQGRRLFFSKTALLQWMASRTTIFTPDQNK